MTNTTTPGTIPDDVRFAISVLDRVDPTWWTTIDLDRLRLESSVDCICGQRYDSYNSGLTNIVQRWEFLESRLGLQDYYRLQVAFFPKSFGPLFMPIRRFDPHRRAWVAEITRRREVQVHNERHQKQEDTRHAVTV